MQLSKQAIKQKLFQFRTTLSLLTTKPFSNTDTVIKTDIFIWGCNDFSLHLCHLLARHNVNVIGFIDPHYTHSEFCKKPVYHSQVFREKTEYAQIPVVIALPHELGFKGPVVNFESIRQFKLRLMEIITDYQIHNPLLHPATLLDISNCTYPKKIIAFGVQGSGNTIYNHIFIKLSEVYARKFQTFNADAHFFEKLCYEYEQCLKQILTDSVYSAGGRDIMVAPWNIGSSAIAFMYGDKKSHLFTLPTRDHITHKAYGYHNIPSEKNLEKLIQKKFKLFLMARNPLDIILSILKKRKGVDKNRQIDFELFSHISRKVVKELTHWSLYFSKLEMLRYEDLINQPIQQIAHVMRKLDIKPSASVAKKLWSQLGFKQLPQAPKEHFNGGGAGKWEQYFTSEHLAYLNEIGIQSVLEIYNYHDALEKFKAKLPAQELQVKPALSLQTLDNHQHALNHLQKNHGDSFTQNGCFYLGTDNPELLRKMKVILDNEYIKKLLAAGRLPQPDMEYPSLS